MYIRLMSKFTPLGAPLTLAPSDFWSMLLMSMNTVLPMVVLSHQPPLGFTLATATSTVVGMVLISESASA